MNTRRMKEIEDFTKDFNEKLAQSVKRYEEKQKLREEEEKNKPITNNDINNVNIYDNKKIKKSLSSLDNIGNYRRRIVSKNYFARINTEQPKKAPSSNNIFDKIPPFIPNNFHCDYFEEFNRLNNGRVLSIWEVERMPYCQRSYMKEKELPQQIDFRCQHKTGDYINPFPNIKSNKEKSLKPLTRTGKRALNIFIDQNDKMEKRLIQKEKELFKYYHSKPPLRLNPWKFSNHIIKEFTPFKVDLIHSFKHPKPEKPTYMTDVYRIPKKEGGLFDKHIGFLGP